jgi:hypothetical protein
MCVDEEFYKFYSNPQMKMKNVRVIFDSSECEEKREREREGGEELNGVELVSGFIKCVASCSLFSHMRCEFISFPSNFPRFL